MKTEKRKQQIINESLKIIHLKGFEKLTIRELSRRVKISEAAIYRHFISKEEIVSGVLDIIDDFNKKLEKFTTGNKNEFSKIFDFALFHFSFFEKNPEITSIIFSEDIFRNNVKLREKLKKIIMRRIEILKEITDRYEWSSSLAREELENIPTLVIGYIRIIVLEWRLSGFKYSLVKDGRTKIRTLTKLLNGFAKNFKKHI